MDDAYLSQMLLARYKAQKRLEAATRELQGAATLLEELTLALRERPDSLHQHGTFTWSADYPPVERLKELIEEVVAARNELARIEPTIP